MPPYAAPWMYHAESSWAGGATFLQNRAPRVLALETVAQEREREKRGSKQACLPV